MSIELVRLHVRDSASIVDGATHAGLIINGYTEIESVYRFISTLICCHMQMAGAEHVRRLYSHLDTANKIG